MISNDFTSHSSGQVILFRNGVINNINIVYSFRRIRITEFEMVSKQIAVGNVYVPAGSRQKYLLKNELACAINHYHVCTNYERNINLHAVALEL